MLFSLQRRAHCQFARASRIDCSSSSNCCSRLNAAHIFFKHLQDLRGLRAAPHQNVVLASGPRTLA
eukprot:5788341-Pyramimonas_sp.AAC.1